MGAITMGITYLKEQRKADKEQKSRQAHLAEAKKIFTCSDSELGVTIDSNGEPKSATISKDFAELAYFSNTYSKYISIDSSFAEPLTKADQKLSSLKQKVESSQNRYASIMSTMPKFKDLRAKCKEAEDKKYSVSPMKYALSVFGIGETAGEIRKSKIEAENNYIKEAFAHKKEVDTLRAEFEEEKQEVMKKVKENLESYHSTMKDKLQVAKEYVAIQDLLKNQTVKTALMSSNKELAAKIENMPYPLEIHDSKQPLPDLPTLAEVKMALVTMNQPNQVQKLDNSIDQINNGLADYTANKRTTTQYAIEAAKKAGEKAREKDTKSTSKDDTKKQLEAAEKFKKDAEERRSQLIRDNQNLFDELEELQEKAKAKDENGKAIPLSQKDLLRLNTLQNVTRNILSDANQDIKRAQSLIEKYSPDKDETTQKQENKNGQENEQNNNEQENNQDNPPAPSDGREDPDDDERT